MKKNEIIYSVFTKPWKTKTTDELIKIVTTMGFNGIEFPLRDGYQVTPQNALTELVPFSEKLKRNNIKITSIAGPTDEDTFIACQNADINLIRIMFSADLDLGYMKSEYKMKKGIEAFLPLCEKYNIKVGIQPHFGAMVSTSMELRHLLEGFDPKYVGAIWDAAHSGLAGEEPEQGLDIVWDYLTLVNLKTAFYLSQNGPERKSNFERYFTTGEYGLSDWERVIIYLKKRSYDGVICLPAEYTDEKNVFYYASKDLKYVKGLVDKYFED